MVSRSLIFILMGILLSCKSKELVESLTLPQKEEISAFSDEILNSFNSNNLKHLNSSWDNEILKERISENIGKTEQNVLRYLSKELDLKIKIINSKLSHLMSNDSSKAVRLELIHFKRHSEMTLLFINKDSFNPIKFRIDYSNRPVITDYFSFREDLWYSKKIVVLLETTNTYRVFSDKRQALHQSFYNSNEKLMEGDTLKALEWLYEIPVEFEIGNWLSLRRLELAKFLGDSILNMAINSEYEINKSPYITYLYHYWHSDTLELKQTLDSLSGKSGNHQILDSLVDTGHFWSVESEEN